MKFRTTAIALAVAGTVAAPVAVQAGADEIYASARVGLWNVDEGGVSDLSVRSFSSRFGMKGETDLGNGMTGFGRYEWDVDFNNDVGEDDISIRHRYVGVKGGLGSVLIGQAYHTFYNFTVAPNDIPWWHSGYNMVTYAGRSDNGITYAGGSGAFAFGASVFFNRDADEEAPDSFEVGASVGIGDMTLGAAVQSSETPQGVYNAGTDDDIIGVTLSGIGIAGTSLGIGFQSQEDDMGVIVNWTVGNAYVHLEQHNVDADSPRSSGSGDDEDRLAITLGYTQSLGRKTTMYFELFQWDKDTGDSDDDTTRVMAVLKYDII